MNHTSEMRPFHEGRPSASSYPSGVPAPAVRDTVLNPEGRPASSEGSTSSTPSAAPITGDYGVAAGPVDSRDSILWRRLFPVDADPAGGIDVERSADCELGHFSIEERIGSGGMGAVFRALDTRLQRVVALKVLSPVQSRDRAAVMRFQNEARAAARLDHENISRVFYIGEDRGLHFIAFEYVTGQNVREIITRTGRLRVADAVNDVLQIASALRHTAAAGVVHRDIKPSNIIITPNGRAKLVDLGLARKLASDTLGDLTVAGTTLGTFDYISPEQARDPRNVDVRSDIYSLGCTLYHMLTGGPPYSSGTVLQKLLDHQSGHAPDPRTINPAVPPALSAICRKMMAGDPKHRFATPDELIRELAVVAAGLGLRPAMSDAYVWTRPQALPVSRLRPGFIWAGSVAVVLLLAFFVDRWPIDRPDPPRDAPPANAGEQSVQSVATAGEAGTDMPAQDAIVEDGIAIGRAIPPDPPAPAPIPEQEMANEMLSTAGTMEILRPPPVTQTTPPGKIAPDAPNIPGDGAAVGDSAITGSSATPSVREMPSAPTRNPDAIPGNEQALRDNEQTFGEFVTTGRAVVDAVLESFNAPPSQGGIASEAAATDSLPIAPDAIARPIPIIPPFTIQSAGAESREFATLAEAISNANSGDVIELRFDGALPAGPITQPIEIDDRQITIQAGRDANNRLYEPIIAFASDPAGMTSAQMIMLNGDSAMLEVNDVQIRMTVDDAAPLSEPGALFVLAGANQVSLYNVAITIDSPRWSCSVFGLRPPSDPSAQAKSLMGMGADRDTFEIDIYHSFIRGTADLVTFGHTKPGNIEIRHSGIVLQQSLLNVAGGIASPASQDVVDVTLEHVTAVLDNPLLRIDLSEDNRYFVPVNITASNNIIATSEKGQLVFMNGASEGTSFAEALDWTGDRNIFDGFSEFWSVRQSADGTAPDFPSSFLAWQTKWSRRNPDSEREPEQAITANDPLVELWEHPEAMSLEPTGFTPDHLRLNPAVTYTSSIRLQATDFGLAGVDPDELPPLVTSTDEAVAQDSDAALP